MIGVVFSVLVVMQYGMAGTSVSHIKMRLDLLESKMYLDSIEFRGEIEQITSALMNQKCDCSEEDTDAVSQAVTAPEGETDYKELRQVVKGLRRGFYNEKKFLRQTINEMSDKVEKHINACEETNINTLNTTLSQLGVLEKRMQENLDVCKEIYNNASITTQSQIGNLDKRFKETINAHGEKYNNTLSKTQSEIGALDKRIVEKLNACKETYNNSLSTTQSQIGALEQRMVENLNAYKEAYNNTLGTTQSKIGALEQRMVENLNAYKETYNNTLSTTQSKFDALEQKMVEKLTDLEDKLNHVEELALLLLKIATKTDANARDEATKQQLESLDREWGRLRCSTNADWKQHVDSCYEFVVKKATWSEAIRSCAGMNSYLAEVNYESEHNFIASIMVENGESKLWLGGSGLEREGKFVWDHSGSPVGEGFAAWDKGRPWKVNYHYNCLYVREFMGFKWLDCSCHRRHAYLCETKIS